MNGRTIRREIPTILGGFLLGLMIAGLLALLWIALTSGSKETFNLEVDARTSAADRGLIGSTYANIATRLASERNVVRPERGNLRFRLANLTWQDPGMPDFVRAPELRGSIDRRAAARGDIIVRGVAVRGGEVYVEQDAQKRWNYRRAFDRLLGEREDDGSPKRSFIVYDVAVTNVDVRVRRPNQSYAINDVAAHLPRLDLSAPALPAPRVRVSRATGMLAIADSTYGIAVENADLEFHEGRMIFNVATVTTGATRLMDFAGSWGEAIPGYGLAATGDVQNVRFEDVRFLGPRVPRTGTAAFGFRVNPINNALTQIMLSNARMESGDSRVRGSATINYTAGTPGAFSIQAIDARFDPLNLALVEQMMGDTLPYRGTIAGTAKGTNGIVNFHVLTRLVAREDLQRFETRVTGSARLASEGFELRRLDANLRDVPLSSLRAFMPGLPLKGNISGRIGLTGPPGRSPLNVNVRLELASGVAIVEGRVDLAGRVPRYDLTGRLIAINIQQLVEPEVPPVFMTARFSVNGAGTDPNTLAARLYLDGRFGGWRTGPHDTIHVAARIENGAVRVDSAGMLLATMSANAAGNWRFVAPAAGRIEYDVAFNPITPFGPYIPAIGDEDASGIVRVAGTVSGERGNIQVIGDGRATAFTVGDWSVSALEAKYQIVMGAALPQFNVEASARDLRTPTAGNYENAKATVQLQSPVFALDVRADRADGRGGIEVVADGRMPPTGAREIVLHRARIDFGEQNWALAGPAVFSWAGPNTDLAVRGFLLRRSDDNGLLRLEGRVLPLANADFTLETTALPVGDIQRLLGRPAMVSGALTTSTTVRTTNGVPQLTTTFQLDSAIVENIHFAQLSGGATYARQRLSANVAARVDTSGALQLRAELPLDLRFSDSMVVRLLDSGPVNITLISDSIALAPFAALHPAIQEMKGTMRTDIRVMGTVQDPILSGGATIVNGSVRVLPLSQRYDSIHANVHLDHRAVVIDNLVVESGGLMRATGSIIFEDLNRPVLDILARFDRFRLIGAENQDDAEATGNVRLQGPLRGALLTGDVVLADGYFPLPQTGSRALDAELARFEADLPRPGAAEAQTPFYDALRIDDLRVTAGENLWFAMEDARAELAGNLVINKSGTDLRIIGELEGTRGTYTLRAGPIIRRFEVVHAHIRFLGNPDINPAIDITARRRVAFGDDRQMDIDVRIGGTLQAPTLALASETAAPIPQSELLSFLLFGQPSFVVGTGTSIASENVTQPIASSFAELISIGLEQELLGELGGALDVFQIRLGGGALQNGFSPSLVLGEEIARNVFLTVESGVTALFGTTQAPLTTFAAHIEWRLGNNTTLRGSYEPVDPFGVVRGYTVALPVLRPGGLTHQKTLELRRRWTW